VLVFAELVSKSLPEQENGARIEEIRVYVFWVFGNERMILTHIKLPLFIPSFRIPLS
jgi:hypothetical protein